MTLSAPRFSPEDIIYIVASAKLGWLESYQVTQVRSVGSTYRYTILIKPKTSSNLLQTVGDRNNLSKYRIIELKEEDICTQCEALILARTYLENRLAEINSSISSFGCEGSA